MSYKWTGGNTTNLHKHLKNKHSNKVEPDVENTSEINKFVIKEIPVS